MFELISHYNARSVLIKAKDKQRQQCVWVIIIALPINSSSPSL